MGELGTDNQWSLFDKPGTVPRRTFGIFRWRNHMKTIFETDLSETASKAAPVAANLARGWNDVLIVATSGDAYLNQNLPEDVSETLSAFVTEKLHEQVAKLQADGLQVEESMLSGPPQRALVDLARKEESRLVVVG